MFHQAQRLAEELLGGGVTLHFDHHIEKAANSSNGTAWHQDQAFESDFGPKLTMWIPLVDVDESNGCIRYIPRSHRNGYRAHDRIGVAGRVVAVDDESSAVSIPLPRGGFVVHSELTIHGASHNASNHSRPAWILRFKQAERSVLRAALTKLKQH